MLKTKCSTEQKLPGTPVTNKSKSFVTGSIEYIVWWHYLKVELTYFINFEAQCWHAIYTKLRIILSDHYNERKLHITQGKTYKYYVIIQH